MNIYFLSLRVGFFICLVPGVVVLGVSICDKLFVPCWGAPAPTPPPKTNGVVLEDGVSGRFGVIFKSVAVVAAVLKLKLGCELPKLKPVDGFSVLVVELAPPKTNADDEFEVVDGVLAVDWPNLKADELAVGADEGCCCCTEDNNDPNTFADEDVDDPPNTGGFVSVVLLLLFDWPNVNVGWGSLAGSLFLFVVLLPKLNVELFELLFDEEAPNKLTLLLDWLLLLLLFVENTELDWLLLVFEVFDEEDELVKPKLSNVLFGFSVFIVAVSVGLFGSFLFANGLLIWNELFDSFWFELPNRLGADDVAVVLPLLKNEEEFDAFDVLVPNVNVEVDAGVGVWLVLLLFVPLLPNWNVDVVDVGVGVGLFISVTLVSVDLVEPKNDVVAEEFVVNGEGKFVAGVVLIKNLGFSSLIVVVVAWDEPNDDVPNIGVELDEALVVLALVPNKGAELVVGLTAGVFINEKLFAPLLLLLLVDIEVPNDWTGSTGLLLLLPINPNEGVDGFVSVWEGKILLLLPNLIGSFNPFASLGFRPKLIDFEMDESVLVDGRLSKLLPNVRTFEPAAATNVENFVLFVESSFDFNWLLLDEDDVDKLRLVIQQAHSSLSASLETKQVEQVHLDDFDDKLDDRDEDDDGCCGLLSTVSFKLGLAVEQHAQLDFDSSFWTRHVEHVHLDDDVIGLIGSIGFANGDFTISLVFLFDGVELLEFKSWAASFTFVALSYLL